MASDLNRAVDAMEKLVRTAQDLGNDRACRMLVESVKGQPYSTRRKSAILIAALRDHKGIVAGAREQPYGWVAKCRNCGMVVKVPLTPGNDDGIQGRAVERDCPAKGA